MIDVVLVHHLRDGSTVAKAWSVSDDQAAELERQLGRPHHEQMLGPDLSEAADHLTARSLFIED
ncbi:hypothetical protein [Micromonospora deserti]|nr:hypothetical protein [Micromonospora deserti]